MIRVFDHVACAELNSVTALPRKALCFGLLRLEKTPSDTKSLGESDGIFPSRLEELPKFSH